MLNYYNQEAEEMAKSKPKLAKAIYEAMINACNCREGSGRVMCSGSKICKLCGFFQTKYCEFENVNCLLQSWLMDGFKERILRGLTSQNSRYYAIQ